MCNGEEPKLPQICDSLLQISAFWSGWVGGGKLMLNSAQFKFKLPAGAELGKNNRAE